MMYLGTFVFTDATHRFLVRLDVANDGSSVTGRLTDDAGTEHFWTRDLPSDLRDWHDVAVYVLHDYLSKAAEKGFEGEVALVQQGDYPKVQQILDFLLGGVLTQKHGEARSCH